MPEAGFLPSCTAEAGDEVPGSDVKRWRKAERTRLIRERLAIPAAARRRHDTRIADCLEAAAGSVEDRVVGAYWPFRGEPNLNPLLKNLTVRGARCVLPVVVAYGEPLVFRAWSPGDPLDRGVWNIPIPKQDAEIVVPDIVIAPLVGFDRACYRLGYGGGFYDRTLAAMPGHRRIFGVGYALAAVRTIHPQWHDISMDAVITEEGIGFAAPGSEDGTV